MKTAMKLRLIGGCVLLFNLWLVGHYNLEGISVLLLTLGFAAGYEYLVVRPASKAASQPAVVPVAPAPFCGSMSPSAPPTPLPTTLPKDQLVSIHTALPSTALVENFSSNEGPVEEFWAQALTELEGPGRRPGLWARVFSATQGNENLAKAQYLQERARELSDVAAKRAAADSLERAQANHIAHEKVIRLKQAFLAGSTLKPDDVAYLARGSNMEQSLTELSERFKGETLLHWCARYGLQEEASILLQNGADARAANGNGLKPFSVAEPGTPIRGFLAAAAGLVDA